MRKAQIASAPGPCRIRGRRKICEYPQSIVIVVEVRLAASALFAFAVLPDAGHTAVGIRHELLELVLKAGGRGGAAAAGTGGGRGCASAPVLLDGLLRGFFDGEVDAADLIDADDLHLDLLPHLQKVAHLIDVGVGDLGNMYQTGLAARQGDERAEFHDPGDLALQDRPNSDIHEKKVPPRSGILLKLRAAQSPKS